MSLQYWLGGRLELGAFSGEGTKHVHGALVGRCAMRLA